MEIVCPAWHPNAERLVEAIGLLSDEGVTAIEIGVGHPEYFDHTDTFELKRLKAELSASGVRAHAIHAPFGPSYDISSPVDSIHDHGVNAIIESLELANYLESECVIIHAGDIVENGLSRRLERAHGVIVELSALATESGIIIAVENLIPSFLGHQPEELFCLIKDTNPKAIRICFDSGHANLSGRFNEFAEALLPYSYTTHIHDNDGREDKHLFPGMGNINWHVFADIYRRSFCSASIMLECMPPENVNWSEAFQCFRNALGD